MKPALVPIKSSMISHHAYDPNARKMTVRFHNGTLYEYDDVPADKQDAFSQNASPGRYFNEKIKFNHFGRKIKS
jgi:hypothetical protein